jgi:trigger factor
MNIGFRIPVLNTLGAFKKYLRLWGLITLCGFFLAGCRAMEDQRINDILVEDAGGVVDEIVTNENIADFITLGQYKGIEYDTVSAEVTDEDVEDWISQHLSLAAEKVEVMDRAVLPGDIVTLDYMGFLDGVLFEDGTAEGFELVIGSNRFIPGFEEQIVGRFISEEFDISTTFPDDYHKQELAGQLTMFKISLRAIYTEVVPQLTDEFVREYLDVATVVEYRALVRGQLEKEKEQEADDTIKHQVWNTIVSNASFIKYPKGEVEYRIDRGLLEFKYHADMYDIELSDFIAQVFGMPFKDFINNEIMPAALIDVGYDLVLRAIAANEGITITDAELYAGIKEFVADFDYSSEEAFVDFIGENAVRLALLSEKVIDFVMLHAIER